MLPEPLHPAIVHFPVVLAVLIPLLAAGAFWAIHSDKAPRHVWLAVFFFQVLLGGTAWLAVETGEHEEDRVERVVAERHIEEHEEAAERFLAMVFLVFPVAGFGLLGGRVGTVNRALTVGLSLAALGAAGAVGHSGGELVYRHGAAQAYTQTGEAGAGALLDVAANRDDHDHDHDHDHDEH